jgi:hypothetical protein
VNTPRAAEWDAFRTRMGLKPLHRSGLTDEELEVVRTGEASAPLLGRCGRRLLGEIESYLEFFAIARSAA